MPLPRVLLVEPGGIARAPLLDVLIARTELIVLVSVANPAAVGAANDAKVERVVEALACQGVADAKKHVYPVRGRACGESVEAHAKRCLALMKESRDILNIDGVVCFDDFGIVLASALAESLGLPCTPLAQMVALQCV